jgi:hypothetical protein
VCLTEEWAGRGKVWAGHLVPEILRRREKSSMSASIICGEACCFRGEVFGEARGFVGDALDVEGEDEAVTFSFGLLELRCTG